MNDDDDLRTVNELQSWGWQRPRSVSEGDYQQIVHRCLSFLSDKNHEISTQTPDVLPSLLESADRRLFGFLPGFHRRIETSDPNQLQNILAEAISWSECRFERMILNNAVQAWKFVQAAGLSDENLDVEGLILRAATERWQKVAMIVGAVMTARRGLVDTAIGEQVKVLVATGLLEAQGDLADMRRSEVRKPMT